MPIQTGLVEFTTLAGAGYANGVVKVMVAAERVTGLERFAGGTLIRIRAGAPVSVMESLEEVWAKLVAAGSELNRVVK